MQIELLLPIYTKQKPTRVFLHSRSLFEQLCGHCPWCGTSHKTDLHKMPANKFHLKSSLGIILSKALFQGCCIPGSGVCDTRKRTPPRTVAVAEEQQVRSFEKNDWSQSTDVACSSACFIAALLHAKIEKHLCEEGYSCHYIKEKDQMLGLYACMPSLVGTYTMGGQE